MPIRRYVVIALSIACVSAAVYIFNNSFPDVFEIALDRSNNDVAHSDASSVTRTETFSFSKFLDQVASESVVALVALTAVLTTLIITRFVSRRRKELLQSPHLVTPENFFKWTNLVVGNLETLAHATNNLSGRITSFENKHQQVATNLSETFLTLNNAIEYRDQQLRRAEQGWERQQFRKFLVRFIRVDQALNDPSMTEHDALIQARELLSDALAECDVRPLLPPVGADYRTTFGVDDQPILQLTDNPKLYFQIISVVNPGYSLSIPDRDDVLVIPAKVKVYSPSEQNDA